MVEITEFILQRIEEDEQIAIGACVEYEGESWTATPWGVDCVHARNRATVVDEFANDRVGAHITRHDPARVLREVAGKRVIVNRYLRERAAIADWGSKDAEVSLHGYLDAMQVIAAVWSDHPDYDPVWNI